MDSNPPIENLPLERLKAQYMPRGINAHHIEHAFIAAEMNERGARKLLEDTLARCQNPILGVPAPKEQVTPANTHYNGMLHSQFRNEPQPAPAFPSPLAQSLPSVLGQHWERQQSPAPEHSLPATQPILDTYNNGDFEGMEVEGEAQSAEVQSASPTEIDLTSLDEVEEEPRLPAGQIMGIRFTIHKSRLDAVINKMGLPQEDYPNFADLGVVDVFWNYLWAICQAHYHFRPDPSNTMVDSLTREAQAHRTVSTMLGRICKNEDYHCDVSDAKWLVSGCSTDVFDVNGILKASRNADHIIPKRRQPSRLEDGRFIFRPDTLVGEAKLKTLGDRSVERLNDKDGPQLDHYLEYLRQGRTQCVFHWIAEHSQYIDKQRWHATTVRLYCTDPQVLKACRERLQPLGLYILSIPNIT